MRVFLIDDSRTMRTIQRNVLGQIGLSEVEEAVDGQDALNKFPQVKPELVLVDWNMPNMDGIQFVKAVRALGSTVPIIMVTTEAEKTKVVEAIKSGVNGYVVKPFTPDTLRQKIEEVTKKAA